MGFIGDDTAIRLAAFEHVRRLSRILPHLTAVDLRLGFEFHSERIPLVNQQRGIFKPKQMRYLLSIRTVFPRPGARVWYDDQRVVHEQIFAGDETIDYAFMGQNAASADNIWLREAMKNDVPVIYFLGISPGCYRALIPTFIVDWDSATLKARIAFGDVDRPTVLRPETPAERRYALRTVKQRLHQDSFRQAVITAYNGRCALSGLPEPRLLDAAHIVADNDQEFGQPIVRNGLPLSKIHHAAFDAHLIGIDPDHRIHVSELLLSQDDGPMLEALKQLDGQSIRPPRRDQDQPDRERLAMRFEQFKAVA
jgi:putative restriction endonuclease